MTNLNEECLLQFLQKARQPKEKNRPVKGHATRQGDAEPKPAHPFMTWPRPGEPWELDRI